MKKLPKFKYGEHYRFLIWDHTKDDPEPVKAWVGGHFISEGKEHIHLSHWLLVEQTKDIVENNLESCALLKVCIIDFIKDKSHG